MNRNRGLYAAVGTALAVLVVAYVAASPQTINTPLYTFRMEQMSSEMSFLPTAVNNFTYNTELGYTLNLNAECCGADPFSILTIRLTCETCRDPTCVTCVSTCLPTCDDTTCQNTCGVSYCVCPTLIGC